MPNHPDRSLGLTGASNFRDFGGYLGDAGRPLRWRRLFRSDHLAGLTQQDQEALRALGVARSFDFRGVAERAAVPYDVPGLTQHAVPIEPTVVQRMKDLLEAGECITPAQTVLLMQETYRAFVSDNSDRFATVFQQLVDSDAPLVLHCTAGKDRTGFAVALVLLALGVSRPVVLQDYLLTNDLYRMPAFENPRVPPAVLQVLWRVQPEFLQAALHVIDQDYGGVERYLQHTLGVGRAERARLAQLYLQS